MNSSRVGDVLYILIQPCLYYPFHNCMKPRSMYGLFQGQLDKIYRRSKDVLILVDFLVVPLNYSKNRHCLCVT